jgi:eukaryotic-like serine/threonine-protein kinase
VNGYEKSKGWTYRLPSEAEWEYACRGGATTQEECSYHFYSATPSNDLSSKEANFDGNYPFGKAEKGPYLGRTTKVGSYAPNKLGLYDMHGNVWQWCSDLYDPQGLALARVLRGGSWFYNGGNCRLAYHSRVWRGRYEDSGFRLAAVPDVGAK